MTRDDLLALVPDLSAETLDALTRAGIIRPVAAQGGTQFRDIDAARARLAVELEDIYGLDTEAVGLVLSLIDELHGMRGEMRAVLGALAEEPPETRARLRGIIHAARVVRVQRR